MDWDIEIKRLISDTIDAMDQLLNDAGLGSFSAIQTKIVDNRLIVSVTYQDEAKDFECTLKEINDNQ